jgi:HSP20 family molecular chaperone IbpA
LSPGHVYVTVELPGAVKDALDIEATERTLSIVAPRVGASAYRLRIELPSRVDLGSAAVTYRNGILDVTLRRAREAGGEPHDP